MGIETCYLGWNMKNIVFLFYKFIKKNFANLKLDILG